MNNTLNDKISEQSLLDAYAKKGYTVFSDQSKNYNLNIGAVRSLAGFKDVNHFNDVMFYFWYFGGQLHLVKNAGTTHPGLYYFQKPMAASGTHILAPNQYRGCYALGRHMNLYPALCQKTLDFEFYVDNDKDGNMDLNGTPVKLNYFAGINCHGTVSANFPTVESFLAYKFPADSDEQVVWNWSAGCMVTARDSAYQEFIRCVYESSKTWGNSFTYTLFEEADFDESVQATLRMASVSADLNSSGT